MMERFCSARTFSVGRIVCSAPLGTRLRSAWSRRPLRPLRGSRFVLRQPDAFGAGASSHGSRCPTSGGYVASHELPGELLRLRRLRVRERLLLRELGEPLHAGLVGRAELVALVPERLHPVGELRSAPCGRFALTQPGRFAAGAFRSFGQSDACGAGAFSCGGCRSNRSSPRRLHGGSSAP